MYNCSTAKRKKTNVNFLQNLKCETFDATSNVTPLSKSETNAVDSQQGCYGDRHCLWLCLRVVSFSFLVLLFMRHFVPNVTMPAFLVQFQYRSLEKKKKKSGALHENVILLEVVQATGST